MKHCFLFNTANIKAVGFSSSGKVAKLLIQLILVNQLWGRSRKEATENKKAAIVSLR